MIGVGFIGWLCLQGHVVCLISSVRPCGSITDGLMLKLRQFGYMGVSRLSRTDSIWLSRMLAGGG